MTQPHNPQQAQHPAPTAAQQEKLNLGLIGVIFFVLCCAGGAVGYVLYSKYLDRQAGAWSFDIKGGADDDAITVDIRHVPTGASITVYGRSMPCDGLCEAKIERKDIVASKGGGKVTVTLNWRGRHVVKSKTRALFRPRLSFHRSGKHSYRCVVTTDSDRKDESVVEYAADTPNGITFKTKGSDGDTVSINGSPPVEPGYAGYEHLLSNSDLLKLLGVESAQNRGTRGIVMNIPVSVKSADGVGYDGKLSCKADILRHYIRSELKAARLAASAPSSPRAGALVVGDDSMFYVGEGATPLDAKLVATVSSRQILLRHCSYGYDFGPSDAYSFFAHDFEVFDLRTNASQAKRRFSAATAGWQCPTSAKFASGERSRFNDLVPERSDEAAWLTTLL